MSHVELTVHDLDRAIEFYSSVFGFEVVHRRDHRAVLLTPGTRSSLLLEQADPRERVSVIRFGLGLADPADLDLALDLTVASGGRVVTRTDIAIGTASAVIADPTGHHITL